jgi:ABC-type glycerol-3-phosphate transport system substrate-binding protein
MKSAQKMLAAMAALCVMVSSGLFAGGAQGSGSAAGTGEVTLSAFIQQSATSESGIWQGWGAKKLYDDTKLKVDFWPTNVEVEQKLQQYLAAGDLPDIIGLKGLDQARAAMDAETLLPLEQYAGKLPNLFNSGYYTNALNYNKDLRSNGENHVYLTPVAVGPTGYGSYNWEPMIQMKAWKAAGEIKPKTLEDYLDITEAMVKAKPVTENGEKTYGFSLFSDWDVNNARQVSTLSFFYGIDTEYVSDLMETNIVTKRITSQLADDSFYKRALQFYFNANQRGLLDPDSMTQTYSNAQEKYNAGRVMFAYFSWFCDTYNAAANGRTTALPPNTDGFFQVPADDFRIYVAPEQTIGRDWYFAINKNTKNLDAALKFLDWIYDPVVSGYLMNGPEGMIWETVNGVPTVKVEDETAKAIYEKNSEPLVPAQYGGGSFRDGLYALNSGGLQASVPMANGYTLGYRYWPSYLDRSVTEMNKEQIRLMGGRRMIEYSSHNVTWRDANSTQAVNMITDPEPSTDLAMSIAQIGEVVKKYSWQMVFARDQAAFNSLWNQMKTEANGLGMQKVVDYYTGQWNQAVQLVDKYE